jgi:hypothetical protein
MLLNYARLELGALRDDPFEGVEIPSPPRRNAVWGPEEVEILLAQAEPRIRRAFMLAAYTAQRPADLFRMTYDCIGQTVERDGRKVLWVMLRQRKTDRPVWVPLHPALREEIATRLHGRSNLIAPSPKGHIWDTHNFARAFREARLAAGLPEALQFRDLRRTAMVRLAEAGASVPQIAAISGHAIEQTQKILEHYVPRSRQMALGAMDLLVATPARSGAASCCCRAGLESRPGTLCELGLTTGLTCEKCLMATNAKGQQPRTGASPRVPPKSSMLPGDALDLNQVDLRAVGKLDVTRDGLGEVKGAVQCGHRRVSLDDQRPAALAWRARPLDFHRVGPGARAAVDLVRAAIHRHDEEVRPRAALHRLVAGAADECVVARCARQDAA